MTPPSAERPPWHCYDTVVDDYEASAVPWFSPLASDLVDETCDRDARRVLDFGAGTGLVARHIRARLGPAVHIVGLDPSVLMLRGAPAATRMIAVNGGAPDTPFASNTFGAVIANLSLSHVPDLEATMAEVQRVLISGGRIGFTAWAPQGSAAEGNERVLANDLAEEVAATWGLVDPTQPSPTPWEAALRDPQLIQQLLLNSSLRDVEIDRRTYRRRLRVDDLVSGWGGSGRYRRRALGEKDFGELKEETRRRLTARFGVDLQSVDHFWIATATA